MKDSFAKAAQLCRSGDDLHDRGLYQEAIQSYRLAIEADPEYSPAYNNLSVTLNTCGFHREALIACDLVLAHTPAHAEALANKGIALKGLGRIAEAEVAYRQALAIQPDRAETYSNLGSLLSATGRQTEAITAYRRALMLKPDLHECRLKLTMLLPPPQAGMPEGHADRQFELALDELANETTEDTWPELGAIIGTAQPFALAYRCGDHTKALSRYGDIACRARSAWFTAHGNNFRPVPHPGRQRIRLVVVSGQVSNHSVWNVILHGLLKHLDRTRFEVVLYNTARFQTPEADLAQRLVDRYLQGTADWLQQVLDDQPDVIFYPEIAMDPVTAQLATLRLAPLQIAGWGHPITTGLPTIDLFCSGELIERPAADRDYRERLVRLPGTGACSVLPPVVSAPPDRQQLDITEDRRITRFLICQQAAKFDPSFDTLYPRIARATPLCRFWFVRDNPLSWTASGLEERLRTAFSSFGLDPAAYIRIVDWLPGEQFLGMLDMMDIYLDTPAFSGYTTAWQALHRGLPIVTMEGPFMRQRLAGGLLRRIGITGTIAADIDEYVLQAVVLADNAPLREKLRGCLIDAIRRTDEDIRVVRGFEETIILQLQRCLS